MLGKVHVTCSWTLASEVTRSRDRLRQSIRLEMESFSLTGAAAGVLHSGGQTP